MDTWYRQINMTTPKHHRKIMEFLVDVLENNPHRGLLTAFRHSGKSMDFMVKPPYKLCFTYLF